jgi:tetratricopeptide (TPR) repeat protein
LRRPLQDLHAWDCVHRGWWHLYKYTREEALEAESLFREAIKLDPEWAIAYLALSQCLGYQLLYHWTDSPSETRVECLELAEKGIELEEDLAQAHACLGISRQLAGDFQGALAAHEQALEMNPSHPLAFWVPLWR